MFKISETYKNTLVNNLPIDLKDDIEAAVHKALEKTESEPLVFQSEKNTALDGRVCDLEKLLKITYEPSNKTLDNLISQANDSVLRSSDASVSKTKQEGCER